MTGVAVPATLRQARAASAGGRDWLGRLPLLVERACRRWHLRQSGRPYGGGACAWVCPARRADGSAAVLKITWPHPEAVGEAAALRRWDGAGAVRLLEEEPDDWAVLLEECAPGTPLRESDLPASRRLDVGAGVLRRLWDAGSDPTVVRPFDTLTDRAAGVAAVAAARQESLHDALITQGVDPGLVAAGVELWRTLPSSATRTVLVHGDLNPGNILAAERCPYLAIDPKPLVGDAAYDPWPLVSQIGWPPPTRDTVGRPPQEPAGVLIRRIHRAADLLGLPADRIAAWGLARDIDAGLCRMAEGHFAEGADWIRAAVAVVPLAG